MAEERIMAVTRDKNSIATLAQEHVCFYIIKKNLVIRFNNVF